jgi:hypothetical protein
MRLRWTKRPGRGLGRPGRQLWRQGRARQLQLFAAHADRARLLKRPWPGRAPDGPAQLAAGVAARARRWSASHREADTRPGTVAAKAFRKPCTATPMAATTVNAGAHRGRHAGLSRANVAACRAKVSVVGGEPAQADAGQRCWAACLPPGNAAARCPPCPRCSLQQGAVENIPFASAQAQVLIGQPGIARKDPTFWPCWWATTSWAAAALSRA